MRELRLVVTQKCPQACLYCHREGMSGEEEKRLNKEDYLFLYETVEEYLEDSRVTITGGEPLTREDIIVIASDLQKAGAEIKLVTNGVFLEEKKEILEYVQEVSISISTLDKEDFSKIHRSPHFSKVIQGIKLASQKQQLKKRLNVCCVKGINNNKQAIRKLIDFASENNLDLRFIELLNVSEDLFVSIEKVEEILLDLGVEEVKKKRTRWYFKSATGVSIELERCLCRDVQFLGDISLCKQENDLFISPDGKWKLCMLKDSQGVDILDLIKNRKRKALQQEVEEKISEIGSDCPMLKNAKEKK